MNPGPPFREEREAKSETDGYACGSEKIINSKHEIRISDFGGITLANHVLWA
jgi:hypothetical protein